MGGGSLPFLMVAVGADLAVTGRRAIVAGLHSHANGGQTHANPHTFLSQPAVWVNIEMKADVQRLAGVQQACSRHAAFPR